MNDSTTDDDNTLSDNAQLQQQQRQHNGDDDDDICYQLDDRSQLGRHVVTLGTLTWLVLRGIQSVLCVFAVNTAN